MTTSWARAPLAAVILLAGAAVPGALAQPAAMPEGRAAVVQKLTDCRKVADNAARLACYDAAAAALDTAEAKGDIVVVDREQARKVRRQAFGFRMPSITLFERGEKPEEIDTMTGVVAAARQNGMGHWVIRLEDGATWSQVDATDLFTDPKAGQPVKIRRASLGSYLMSIGNQRAIRVRREE
jgi:hypothetical protein